MCTDGRISLMDIPTLDMTLTPVDRRLSRQVLFPRRRARLDLVLFTSADLSRNPAVLEERIQPGCSPASPGSTWTAPKWRRPRTHAGALTCLIGISYLNEAPVLPSTPGVPRGRVARYAWGLDYHEVFKQKLWALHTYVQEQLGRPVDARALVDTARIVDKAVAQRAGMGWYGKNTNLLTHKYGSWILLGELLLDVALPHDEPVKTHCGSCTRCMPACPTGAIIAPGVLDSNRCISYLTIELRGRYPSMSPSSGTGSLAAISARMCAPST